MEEGKGKMGEGMGTSDRLAENLLMLWKVLRSVSHPVKLGEITQEQYWLLRQLRGGSKTVGELAEALEITQSSVTTACKRMEQKGLLTRQRDREDERVVQVSLTAYGAQQMEIWQQRRIEALTQLLSPLSAAEQETLNHLIERILSVEPARPLPVE